MSAVNRAIATPHTSNGFGAASTVPQKAFDSEPLLGPLSVGNVVNVALRFYQARWKLIFGIMLRAHLWLLVPVYGWAKFLALQGAVARLCFCELSRQPESVLKARQVVNRRLWRFLLVTSNVNIRLFLIFMGLYMAAAVVLVFLVGSAFYAAPDFTVNWDPVLYFLFFGTTGATVLCVFALCFSWFISRWWLTDVILAIETHYPSAKSPARSWQLTKAASSRIQRVLLILTAILQPFFSLGIIAIQLTNILIRLSLDRFYNPIDLLIAVGFSIALWPLVQVIKAVVYYDLRARREALDLQMPQVWQEQ